MALRKLLILRKRAAAVSKILCCGSSGIMRFRPEAMGAACSRRSRPLRAAAGGGLRPALTDPARAALAALRSGRRDGPVRSNKGMSSAAMPRSGWGEELLGSEILVVTPHRMQAVPQFAHQRDDRLPPGLAMGDQPLDKACPWQGTGGGGRRAAPRRGQRRIEQGLAPPLIAPLGKPRPARQAGARGFLADVEPGLGDPL